MLECQLSITDDGFVLLVALVDGGLANEDLVELFETTGQVELVEILSDGTRSKGAGVVQFAQVTEAETVIGMSFFFFPLVLFISTTKRAMQQNYSSICMVGGPSTCGSTTVGTCLHRRLLRAGKRFR